MYLLTNFKLFRKFRSGSSVTLYGKNGFIGDIPSDNETLFKEIVRQFGLHATIDTLKIDRNDTKKSETSLFDFMISIKNTSPFEFLRWVKDVKSKYESLGTEEESILLEKISTFIDCHKTVKSSLNLLFQVKRMDSNRKSDSQILDDIQDNFWTLNKTSQNKLFLAMDSCRKELNVA